GLPSLTAADYARVTAYDLDRNWLRCEGRTVASSESLTHAAVYEGPARISAVIHCHSGALWEQLLALGPITSATVEYGTPAMAREVQRLFRETDVRQQQIFAMAGHENGVVAFGRTAAEAMVILRQRAGRI
ncbi:MAG: class II aldolase/adducin family protein, partial [Verrucomicrobiota bacterium]|nr:class II aldolase/adducin family protein [Verrucomicrobiota bacterium]